MMRAALHRQSLPALLAGCLQEGLPLLPAGPPPSVQANLCAWAPAHQMLDSFLCEGEGERSIDRVLDQLSGAIMRGCKHAAAGSGSLRDRAWRLSAGAPWDDGH